MRTFTFYGLDQNGKATASEEFKAVSAYEGRALAQRRLPDFSSVEVWEGAVLIVRLKAEPKHPRQS